MYELVGLKYMCCVNTEIYAERLVNLNLSCNYYWFLI